MAVKFRTVKRRVLTGVEKDKVKKYAMAKTTGVCDMQKLCKLISGHCTVASADVKAVLDSLNWAMDLELEAGNVVQVGELGNFRLSLSSDGVDENETFKASKIRKANIIFFPGKSLRTTRNGVSFVADDGMEDDNEPAPGGNGEGGDDVLE